MGIVNMDFVYVHLEWYVVCMWVFVKHMHVLVCVYLCVYMVAHVASGMSRWDRGDILHLYVL